MPSKIMIIRHGEKPTEKSEKPYGVNADGKQDFESLLVRGWQRAGALAVLFDPARGPLQSPDLAIPDIVYASYGKDKPDDTGSKSQRPLQTITPLADRLGITPNTQFEKGDETPLAADVMKRAGTVLISWQHQNILAIVNALTAGKPVHGTIPAAWPDDRFDIVWVLTPPVAGTDFWTFTQVPQCLLSGDKRTIIA